MSQEIIFLVSEAPEGGYEARALSASIFTEADTLEELRTMLKDAVSAALECHAPGDFRTSLRSSAKTSD